MAKTFIDFEGKWIDVYNIKTVDTVGTRYNDKTNELEFTIDINKEFVDAAVVLPIYCFTYKTEQQRNDNAELLRIQLEGLDFVNFI